MKIVLIGIQGSGKSTQGNMLSSKLNVPYLSTGHIIRELAKEKTPLGRYLKEIINVGFLVPDDHMIRIVNDYLEKPEYKDGYIIDGYPRTIGQAESFNGTVDSVIYIKLSDDEAIKRLTFRGDGLREDDVAPVIMKRLELFHEFTEPVLDFYKQKGTMHEINGEKSVDDIHKDIMEALSKS